MGSSYTDRDIAEMYVNTVLNFPSYKPNLPKEPKKILNHILCELKTEKKEHSEEEYKKDQLLDKEQRKLIRCTKCQKIVNRDRVKYSDYPEHTSCFRECM